MRVFVTGATGFVGTAVVKELLAHDHNVLGLVRSSKSAGGLEAQGAETITGTIEDLDVLRKGASQCDAVIHLAFIHDFANFQKCCEIDRAAITAMGDALVEAGGDRAFVITSGTMMLKQGVLGDEDTEPDTGSPLAAARGASEKLCLDYAAKALRTSVVRLPPSTHGPGLSGFMGMFVGAALQKGVVAYVGDGQNHWAAGHRDDAAQLYRLAVEKAKAGSVFHASVEEAVTLKDIATEIGNTTGLPVKSIAPEDAQEHFGGYFFIALADNLASCAKTKERLGWTPKAPSLLEDTPAVVEFMKTYGAEGTAA